MKKFPPFKIVVMSITMLIFTSMACKNKSTDKNALHTWEMKELTFHAEKKYNNYYTDVTFWIDLEGPDFSKKVYGFWDGEDIFKVRVVATNPGKWRWKSSSDQPDDNGLNNKTGEFEAVRWEAGEIAENPNRHGFVRPSANGHSLQYADGTPFFMLGDTWLAGATWRLPFRNATSPANYEPSPGIGFEDAVTYRKKQGFNSVSMIASFPNWEADENPNTYADSNGIYLRNAWEKFGYTVKNGQMTSKDMRDEKGINHSRCQENILVLLTLTG